MAKGKKTGGRVKGSINRTTRAKLEVLHSVEELFKAKGYNPITEMINLVQKPRFGKSDVARFDFHHKLAMRHYPFIASIKVDATVSAGERFDTPEKRRARIAELEAELKRGAPTEPIQLIEGQP